MLQFDANKIRETLNNPNGSTKNYPNSRIIWKMLMRMYERHTKLTKSSGEGFNRYDEKFLSSVAESSRSYRDLSPKQARVVAKVLMKYLGQLVDIANEKQEVKAPPPVKEKKVFVPQQMEMKTEVIRILRFED